MTHGPQVQAEYLTHERETKVYFTPEAIEQMLLDKAREMVGYTGENVHAEVKTVERTDRRQIDLRVWVSVVEDLQEYPDENE